ncbi:neutral/alkaline non-lysosomal ceramidase N-terminal domain-containing protein [Alcanivorax sp. S6407]|uniref:neutral/alkaline non-lysosomal ceramidase N-terminal domain-containing protein n=1 Tax=Alcanivorax sp. S6407 TaxID=2926424 RepID=UPI001FF560A2|nr:neutral/alkaline non-lysosomal ceramidase N-terminal domain-containing protein [Alcanivorax sp. S6407]MCK0152872.1 neutral/alkaline non-lysosomal ceramidase N-terminal domain-containing protein [Alcanivorax sp. S6407]
MDYRVGWAKQEIDIEPCGYAMHGFGQPGHRATAVRNPLFARSFVITDEAQDESGSLLYCCLDLGYITHAMRQGVVAGLREQLGEDLDESRLVLTCTHTHSGPGGCAHEGLYNLVTPGFVPAHLEAVVEAALSSLLAALQSRQPTLIEYRQKPVPDPVPVAWNRSLKAYNRNPDVAPKTPDKTHLALDRTMHLISFHRAGKVEALLSLFGVHATCLGSQLSSHDGDNKGYAALHAESSLKALGAENPVAIFAQGTAGDVSPHYHGPGDRKRRRKLRGEAEYAYARQNGQQQSEHAFAMLDETGQPVTGELDGVLTYADMSDQTVAAEFAGGRQDARTSSPCHGVGFFLGTPIDGPGMPAPLGFAARQLARSERRKKLKPEAAQHSEYRKLYDSQGPKDILLNAGRKTVLGYTLGQIPLPDLADPLVAELKRQAKLGALTQSPMVPTVLPLQILRLGNLRLVCAPGEFTTVAGRRLVSTVAKSLSLNDGETCLINTYCNDYMGYVTTYEEYQEQAYEGGHTVYGQWTLGAFQTCFVSLAEALKAPRALRRYDTHTMPVTVPDSELALRSGLPPRS